MNEKQHPTVSCIMPTYNRREFVPHAIRYFLRQDYENKELIIMDDGTDTIADLVPAIDIIRYFKLDQKITLGAKLNMACKYAKGNVIVNWDDDDWYSPTRLKYQVDALRINESEVCGINNLFYFDLRDHHSYLYKYPSDQRIWLLGSSLCYTKKIWEEHHFADINVGMDGLFIWAIPPDNITVLPDSTMAVHMIHDNNVSPKKTGGAWWHTFPVEGIQEIMQADWAYYCNWSFAKPTINIRKHDSEKSYAVHPPSRLKNIYACLVHESKDCIIDLVNNLHYHDPASTILLYNGGQDADLVQKRFPFNQFGAIIYPKPNPVKHGYLLNFALDCMQFVLKNFAFDTITIVDSDQLAIRSGYSDYLGEFLSCQSNIGMLSSNAERVTQENTDNCVAHQAFKEYDLWKPFINSIPEGEKKFAYWTFWPSTVFTSDAVRDLVKLFKENRLLQDIMRNTKIWASEEVILPTLVKLLGYEIATNPCSYDLVRYKTEITIEDINYALNKTDVYWMHPVMRNYNDPIRTHIRQHFNQYTVENKEILNGGALSQDMLDLLPLINKINKIEGWLTDGEAELLISTTIKACKILPSFQTIVEIGSYHGKSTVLFGSVLKAFFPGAKVYAFDPHDGKLGASDNGLQMFPPSFDRFKKNIQDAGISDVTEAIRNNAYNVKWELPVLLLLVDGLHDYFNVARDFHHFSGWIVTGGYVAFHDYADYFPGVKNFVNELLTMGTYKKIGCVDSLIVVQKL